MSDTSLSGRPHLPCQLATVPFLWLKADHTKSHPCRDGGCRDGRENPTEIWIEAMEPSHIRGNAFKV